MSPRRAALPVLVALLACAFATSAPPPAHVAATLQPTRGNSAAGAVWFIAEGADLRIRGRVTGLLPNQEHGFHVHEKGDCSSGDGMSAGGHFNPTGKPHGPPRYITPRDLPRSGPMQAALPWSTRA
jgi:Cu-Zn family superoxide dismutase